MCRLRQEIVVNWRMLCALDDRNNKKSGTINHVSHGGTCDETYQMAYAKVEGMTTSELLEIKNNLLSFSETEYIQTSNIFGNIEDDLKKFHKHYQQLASTIEKQKQCLEKINTQLCDHCLIPCDFQYCNECDLIYNPSPHMIYIISEKEKPISSCALESELIFNPNSNSDNNNNKNTGFSFIQYGDNNDNNSNSDLNPDPDYEQYIALPDLAKKQELKWFSNNNKGIMPE
ncbi:hypothetical protein G9A89_019237 [Geosiphon pyriformis]|nr:hypothetical protein G9A89_019237 [Geosiphon pyriformis]